MVRVSRARSHYHAAMTQQEREEVQANWTHDRMQIIVATIAFGMGECLSSHHTAASAAGGETKSEEQCNMPAFLCNRSPP